MKIKDTFDPSKDINRRIEKVISYAADQPESLQTEISEYVVTERIEDNFERLLSHMQTAMETGGVMTSASGFPVSTVRVKARSPNT